MDVLANQPRKTIRVRRSLGLLVALLLALLGGGVATAMSASAHTHNVTLTCKKVTVVLSNYAGSHNRLKIKVNNATKYNEEFGSSANVSINVDPGDEVLVETHATDDPDGVHGWSFTFKGTVPKCDSDCPPNSTVTQTRTETVTAPPVTVTETQTAPPVTITQPGETTTITQPPVTETLPPVTVTETAPPVTVTETQPPVTITQPGETVTETLPPVTTTSTTAAPPVTITEPGQNVTHNVTVTKDSSGKTIATSSSVQRSMTSLPRTGVTIWPWALAAAVVIALGVGLVAYSRRIKPRH